ncbi:MAG: PIN domain-containing protein [Dehalococcoidia bacterium]
MTAVALLDANVLVPAALRDTLLRSAEARLYEVHWSALILEEMRRTLVRDGLASPDAAARLVTTMQRAFHEADVRGFEARIPEMVNHPKDRHVLAAAVTGGASVIVTHNVRDFPPSALMPYGVAAQTPGAFLITLLRSYPRMMLRLLRQQARDLYQPPQQLEDVLQALTRDAPDFVAAVQETADRGRL